MPEGQSPAPTAKQRQIHRQQVSLVQASLRAGVQYQRHGRVEKHAKRSST